jgi:hypothetical protein
MGNSTRYHQTLAAPDGASFTFVDDDLERDDAVAMVEGGALIAIDPCGDGCAGIDWPDQKTRTAMAKRGMLLKRREQGELERWHDDTGRTLVFVNGGELRT